MKPVFLATTSKATITGGPDNRVGSSSSLSKDLDANGNSPEKIVEIGEDSQKVRKDLNRLAAQTFEERSYGVGGNRVERYVRSEGQKRRDFVEARCKRIKNEQRLERFMLKMKSKKLTVCSVVLSRGKMKHGLDLEATEFEVSVVHEKVT